MASIVEWYRDVMYNKNDPRTDDWFLVSTPGPLLIIILSYIYFCISAGPRFMRDRKPMQLRTVLILYNLIQILASMYLVHEGLVAGWLAGYRFAGEPVRHKNPMLGMRMAKAVHLYFLAKLTELLDTVFFVLRKKHNQISFLHVYHHALMPVCGWIAVRFFPGGHVTLLGLINSFIHVFMYAYYMLSSIGPHMQKYLWWKKYLTIMQIVQFAIIFVQNVQVVIYGYNYPRSLFTLLSINVLLFMYLFGSFYYNAYVRPTRQKVDSREIENSVRGSAAAKEKRQ